MSAASRFVSLFAVAAALAAAGCSSSCVDNNDGTYTCRWEREVAGAYNVFIKMDGLHVLGSPAVVKLRDASEGVDR